MNHWDKLFHKFVKWHASHALSHASHAFEHLYKEKEGKHVGINQSINQVFNQEEKYIH